MRASYHSGAGSNLIARLQSLQAENGYLSQESLATVADEMGFSLARVYGVATFYNQFRFEPRGRFHIQVCRGTACHVKGSKGLLETLERKLAVPAGRTTADGHFSLEVVACIGACGLAPAAVVNGEVFGGLTPVALEKLLARLRRQARGEAEHEKD